MLFLEILLIIFTLISIVDLIITYRRIYSNIGCLLLLMGGQIETFTKIKMFMEKIIIIIFIVWLIYKIIINF